MICYFEAWRTTDSSLETFFQGPQDLHNEFEGYKTDRYFRSNVESAPEDGWFSWLKLEVWKSVVVGSFLGSPSRLGTLYGCKHLHPKTYFGKSADTRIKASLSLVSRLFIIRLQRIDLPSFSTMLTSMIYYSLPPA